MKITTIQTGTWLDVPLISPWYVLYEFAKQICIALALTFGPAPKIRVKQQLVTTRHRATEVVELVHG